MKPTTRIQTERLPRKITGPLVSAFFIFYFIFHVLSGEHGLYALLKEQRRLEILKAELIEATAERKELGHRVHLMNSDSLNLDMLDEQSRAILDNAGSDELVIPVK